MAGSSDRWLNTHRKQELGGKLGCEIACPLTLAIQQFSVENKLSERLCFMYISKYFFSQLFIFCLPLFSILLLLYLFFVFLNCRKSVLI